MPDDDNLYLAHRYATKIGRMTIMIEKIAVSQNPMAEELVEAWMDFLLVHMEQIELMQSYMVAVRTVLQPPAE